MYKLMYMVRAAIGVTSDHEVCNKLSDYVRMCLPVRSQVSLLRTQCHSEPSVAIDTTSKCLDQAAAQSWGIWGGCHSASWTVNQWLPSIPLPSHTKDGRATNICFVLIWVHQWSIWWVCWDDCTAITEGSNCKHMCCNVLCSFTPTECLVL